MSNEFPISARDYQKGIKEAVEDAIAEAEGDKERAQDLLRETADDHEYIIYPGKAICVLFHSSNDSAYFDEFGAEGLTQIAKKEGWNMVYTVIASYAFLADCLEKLEDLWEDSNDEDDNDD